MYLYTQRNTVHRTYAAARHEMGLRMNHHRLWPGDQQSKGTTFPLRLPGPDKIGATSGSSRGIEFSPRLRIITGPYSATLQKETRGTVASRRRRRTDSSSVHYRRSGVHIRRETRPKTGSADRFYEPHAPSDPGTHTTPSPPSSSSSCRGLSFTATFCFLRPCAPTTPAQASFLLARRSCTWKQRLPRVWRANDMHGCGLDRALALPTPYFRR